MSASKEAFIHSRDTSFERYRPKVKPVACSWNQDEGTVEFEQVDKKKLPHGFKARWNEEKVEIYIEEQGQEISLHEFKLNGKKVIGVEEWYNTSVKLKVS
jgi:hypothetical protein